MTLKTFHFKLAVLAAALALSQTASAKTFKWTSASDIPTMDIHSQNNALGNGVHAAIYESLVYYNSKSFKIEPQLATSWTLVNPTLMRIELRNDQCAVPPVRRRPPTRRAAP